MLSEIDSALSIWDKFTKWRRSRKAPVESVATRFVRLLENHGVHRNQIPRFIGHNLTLKDVEDDATLLAKLNEEILDTVCTRFAIRREWLDGAESRIHPSHNFYKQPKAFADFIERLKANNPNADLQGVVVAPIEQDNQAYALLILQETIGSVGDKPVYRYHLCNNWDFTYWKARAYLTACIAIAWKQNVFIHGIYMPKKGIEQLAEGKTLLGWQGEGIWKLGHKTWDPEDMALQPETFLYGIDSGEDNFSVKSGLELWLDLEQRGLMDTGIKANVRQLFQQELAKYSANINRG